MHRYSNSPAKEKFTWTQKIVSFLRLSILKKLLKFILTMEHISRKRLENKQQQVKLQIQAAKEIYQMKKSVEKNLEKIAKDVLFVETLETRNSDGLDFYDISVWGLKEALLQAYKLGQQNK